MKRLSVNEALGEVVRRYEEWLRSHEERGCIALGIDRRTAAALLRRCQCACPDHGCAGGLYDCRVCRDTGFVPHGPRGAEVICIACHTPAEVARWQRSYLARGFPAAVWDKTTLAGLGGDWAPLVRAWTVEFDPPWLVLAGDFGTGKTYAAVAVGKALVAAGYLTRFVTAIELLDQLRATFDTPGDSLVEIEDRYRLAPALILDDLGAEHATPFARERLTSVLDERWRSGRLTVITTNLTGATAPRERLWSRVFGDRLCRVVLTGDADQRRREPGRGQQGQ